MADKTDSGDPAWVNRWRAMEIIGVSERQLYRLIDEGRLRQRRVPRPGRRAAVFYSLEDVNAIRDERRPVPPSVPAFVPVTAVLNNAGIETAGDAVYLYLLIGQLYLQVRDLEETLSRRQVRQNGNTSRPEDSVSSSPSE